MKIHNNGFGYVYVLLSLKDNKRYIGSTIDVNNRLAEHNKGNVKSTKYRRPFVLKYLFQFENIKIAATMEKKFKRSHDALLRELKKQTYLKNYLRGVVHR